MGPLQDSRTGQDLLPMLLQGRVLQRHLLDFSGFHTAVLWLGSSIIAAGAISFAQPCDFYNVTALGTYLWATPALLRLVQTFAKLDGVVCSLLYYYLQPRLLAHVTSWHVQWHTICLCEVLHMKCWIWARASSSLMRCLLDTGVIRALGAEVAEMPALAVRPELQGNSLGRLLMALLENALREAGVKLVAMPALVPFPTSSPKQGPAPDGQMTAAAADEQVSPCLTTCSGYLMCSIACTSSKKPVVAGVQHMISAHGLPTFGLHLSGLRDVRSDIPGMVSPDF